MGQVNPEPPSLSYRRKTMENKPLRAHVEAVTGYYQECLGGINGDRLQGI
jgi:hypothetical protein